MDNGEITIDLSKGVTTITLSRPKRRNALNLSLWQNLATVCEEVAGSTAKVVIVRGAGGNFCSGMDLNPDNSAIAQLLPAISNGDKDVANGLLLELKGAINSLTKIPVPVIACVEGFAVGGGLEIALACDIMVTEEDSSLSLPEVRIGMTPDLGGVARLTRAVGAGRAADLILTGRRFTGREALNMGVAQHVAPNGSAYTKSMEIADMIKLGAPFAVGAALKAIRSIPDLNLKEALAADTHAGVSALTSGEAKEGIMSFIEKRAPGWQEGN
jgi:enoyl-CoA hydratase/carnithine racemase